jgi:endoglucanase
MPRVGDDWDWSNLSNLGLFSYVDSERSGKDDALSDAVREAVIASADRLVTTTDRHPFFRGLGQIYYWGANGLVARSLLNLGVAYRLTGDEDYRRVAQHQLGHLFGVNAQGRSFVTGVGFLPPLQPHHRPSGADSVDAPWPGLLVGGPNPQIPTNDPSAAGVVPDPDAPAPF